MSGEPAGLRRGLGPAAASALVVGTILGTGVFLKAAVMAQLGGSAAWVLAAWAVAGGLSLLGAMTYAELGAARPDAGGEYVYLREAYGPAVAYLYGWNRFWIVTPCSIAAYAVGASVFVASLVPAVPPPVTALGAIGAFTAANCLDVRQGGALQAALTAAKVGLVVAFAAAAVLAPGGRWAEIATAAPFPGSSAFGAMVLAALWAYDGWNNLPMAAGEVRDPARTLPLAIVGGTLAVLGVYGLVHVGYFAVLPFSEVATSSSTAWPDAPAVAARVAERLVGGPASGLLAAAMALSAVSAMHGSMLTGARVPYAMAVDGLAPRMFATLSPAARVPRNAVVAQGALAVAFSATGRFDQLTDAVVFASWLFYALNGAAVPILRRREPDRPRPFLVPGYPVVPLGFVAMAVALLAQTVWTSPRESLLGLAATALGGVAYAAWTRWR